MRSAAARSPDRSGPSQGGRGGGSPGWHHHRVVIIFLAWVVVGVVMWRGYHRLAMGGAVAAMLATLLMLREHATDVIGLCL